jgi:hypothetical protein
MSSPLNRYHILKPLLRELLFWAGSFVLLLRFFMQEDEVLLIDLIYTGLIHLPLVLGVILHHQLIQRFFRSGHLLIYTVLSLVTASVLMPGAYRITFDHLAGSLFPDYYFVALYTWVEIAILSTVYLSVRLFLFLGADWARQQQQLRELVVLKEQKTTAELHALRAQIHPHFLFNTLNTIYGEAMKGSSNVQDLILELSDILRYVTDHSESDSVPLKQEIRFLEQFIRLHQARYYDREIVRFTVEGDAGAIQIPPLLLITFVENCFKHGDLSQVDSVIEIRLTCDSDQLQLRTRNAVPEMRELPERTSGVGLNNARKRMDLRYGDRYKMEFHQEAGHYTLELTIQNP